MALHETPSGFLHGRPVERAKTRRKRDQLLVIQRLIAKQQYQVIDPGAVNLREDGRVDGLEVDALDFRGERAARRLNLDAGCLGRYLPYETRAHGKDHGAGLPRRSSEKEAKLYA